MKLHLFCGLLTFLAMTTASSAASAQALYEGEILSIRGSTSSNGTSLGAFATQPGSFSFQGTLSKGDFVSGLVSLGDLLGPGATTGTTLNCPDSTAGATPQPFSLLLYLPNFAGGSTPILYNINGSGRVGYNIHISPGLSITSTPEGVTTMRFSGGALSEDPSGNLPIMQRSPAR